MQESISLVSHTHKTGIQSGHQLADFGKIDVAHGELLRASFFLELNQTFVLKQGDGDVFGLNINDYFACHRFGEWGNQYCLISYWMDNCGQTDSEIKKSANMSVAQRK